MVALRADSLKACSVLAVMKRCACQDLRLRTQGVGAGDDFVSFIEMSVAELATWAFLGLSVKLGGNLDGTRIGEVGWRRDLIRKGRSGSKKPLHGFLCRWRIEAVGAAVGNRQ